jgi:hypothetical protein
MRPRGVKKGTKRARQYEHVKESELVQGRSEGLAEEIAARTVNKERARAGESRQPSSSSTRDISSGRRGGCGPARTGRRDAPTTSSTTRRVRWASRAARRCTRPSWSAPSTRTERSTRTIRS